MASGTPWAEYDGYKIWEAPDAVSMDAVAIAISGGGAFSKFETTQLLTVEEMLVALRRAPSVGYRKPGAYSGTAGGEPAGLPTSGRHGRRASCRKRESRGALTPCGSASRSPSKALASARRPGPG